MAGRFEEKKPTYTLFPCTGFCTTNQVNIMMAKRLIIINNVSNSVFFIYLMFIVSLFFLTALHHHL